MPSLQDFQQYTRCVRAAVLHAQAHNQFAISQDHSARIDASRHYHQRILYQALAQDFWLQDIAALSYCADASHCNTFFIRLCEALELDAAIAIFTPHLQCLEVDFSVDACVLKRTSSAITLRLLMMPLSHKLKPKHQQQLEQRLYWFKHSSLYQALEAYCYDLGLELSVSASLVGIKADASLHTENSQKSDVKNTSNVVFFPELKLVEGSAQGAPQEMAQALETVKALEQFNALLQQYQNTNIEIEAQSFEAEPKGRISKYCWQSCAFKTRCFGKQPTYSILDAPLLRPEQKRALLMRYGLDVSRYPHDLSSVASELGLTPKQQAHFAQVQQQQIQIDWPAIATSLEARAYPIAYLDFEADNPPLNAWGQKPFSKVVFQYSLHRAENEAQALMPKRVSHSAYLHDEASDPRYRLAHQLVQSLQGVNTVFVWHAEFERKRLLELARLDQAFSPLADIANKLIDLEVVMRKYYHDYRFKGSYSLKQVSQVLLPKAYHGCEVSDGRQAVDVWLRFIHTSDASYKQRAEQQLLAYCEQDTYALVELLALLLQGIKAYDQAFD